MLITNQIQLSFLFCPNHSSNNRNVIVYLPDFVPTSPACVVRIEELSSGAISSDCQLCGVYKVIQRVDFK